MKSSLDIGKKEILFRLEYLLQLHIHMRDKNKLEYRHYLRY
jgi:hypothetical protein